MSACPRCGAKEADGGAVGYFCPTVGCLPHVRWSKEEDMLESWSNSTLRARVAELEASLAANAAWLHERDMRVAEAVREACIDAVAQSMRDGEAWSVDIAAVIKNWRKP